MVAASDNRLEATASLLAMRQGKVGLYHPLPLAVVTVSGPDAADYLHRRTCNEMRPLAVSQGQMNAVLGRKAETAALFHLWRASETAYWLTHVEAQHETLLTELNKYHLTEDLVIAPTPGTGQMVALYGSAWRQAHIPASVQELSWQQGAQVLEGELADSVWIRQPLLSHGRDPVDGWLVWIPQHRQVAWQHWLSAQPVAAPFSWQAWDGFRVEAGLIWPGIDWFSDTPIPQLALEHWTVSYTKGCYLGQETVAKVRTYGAIPYAIMGLKWADSDRQADLKLPASVQDETGKAVGELTTVAWSPSEEAWVGLASLHKSVRLPNQTSILQVGGQPFSVTVRALPLVSPSLGALAEAKRRHDAAVQQFLAGHSDTALEELRLVVRTYPDFLDAMETLGVLLGRMQQPQEAIVVTQRLLAADPDRVMAYTNLSRFYLQLGDKDTAETYKAKATTVAMRQAMQQARLQHQQTTTAHPSPAHSVTAQPPLNAVTPVVSDAQRQTLEKRAALFRQALQTHPDDPLALYGLGSVALELGEWEEACTMLEQVVARQPGQSKAYLQWGQALEALQQHTEAERIYRQGLGVATQRGDLMVVNSLNERLEALRG